MKRLAVLSVFLLWGGILFSQGYIAPKDYKLYSPEDFRKYEQEITLCIDYMYKTPLHVDVENRKMASTFFNKWIYGTPDIEIVVYKKIIPFINNKQLFEIFLCGYVKKDFELKTDKQTYDCYLNGLIYVVKFYEKNRKFVRRSASIEKYTKLYRQGKLEGYLKQKLEEM